MPKQAGPYTTDATAMTALARAIERFAQTDGDHTTAIPALTLHRRCGIGAPGAAGVCVRRVYQGEGARGLADPAAGGG